MSIMMVVVFLSVNTVTTSWHKASDLADKLQHSDYALSQVVSGLRSAYFPTTGSKSEDYGFALFDEGSGADAKDRIRWTKLGTAIVGASSSLAQTPHTVELWVEEAQGDEPGGLMAKAWRGELQTDDFDPEDEEQVKPYLLVDGISAFNCRVLDASQPFKNDGSPNWQDEWNSSNSIPRAVELTFILEPADADSDDEPVEIRRYVNIPLWDISQNPIAAGSDNGKSAAGARGGNGRSGSGGGSGTGGRGSRGDGGSGTSGPPGGPPSAGRGGAARGGGSAPGGAVPPPGGGGAPPS